MSTTLPRVQVTLPPDIAAALKALAKRDEMSLSSKALSLIRSGLEIYEDMVFDRLASERASEKGVRYLTHDEVWK